MARKIVLSHQVAVGLSEKAAIEQQVASSFIDYWQKVVRSVEAEFDAITDSEKEQIVHVFYAVEIVSTFYFPRHKGLRAEAERVVADYLFGRKKKTWRLKHAVPDFLLGIAPLPDSEFQKIYNVSERMSLMRKLNEVKRLETCERLFFTKGRMTNAQKTELITDLEHDISVNLSICKILEKGGVDQIRQNYVSLFYRHGAADAKLSSAQARARAEKDARRLLAGHGRKK